MWVVWGGGVKAHVCIKKLTSVREEKNAMKLQDVNFKNKVSGLEFEADI